MEEQLQEVRKWEARRDQLEIMSQMDEPLKEKLIKRDILTYSRRKKVSNPPPLATKLLDSWFGKLVVIDVNP